MRLAQLALLLVTACGASELELHEGAYLDHDLGSTTQGLNAGQAGGCDTSIVVGLTNQLVAELNCIAPNTMVDFRGPDIVLNGAVQPYLSPGAAAAMKAAVAASGTTLTLSSAYRSVAQQYLLLKWYRAGQCGIQAAATPGSSNHQSGRAIDVPSYNFWISKLQAKGWTWFGSGDLVHFDYLAAPNLGSNSVLAFQKLWNKNNANQLAEDGDWGPATEGAMAASPTTGFATFGCGTVPPPQTGTLKGRVYRINPADAADLSQIITTASVQVAGKTLTVDATGMYSVDLPVGAYGVTAVAGGFTTATLSRMVVAGQVTWGSVGLNPTGTADTQPPQLELASPANGATVGMAQVTLAGTASDAQGTVASLTLSVNGAAAQPVALTQGAFSQAVHLEPGANLLQFHAADDHGNATTLDVALRFTTGIDGLVLNDVGSMEAAEVSARNDAGNTVSTQSAADGTFHLDLLPGHYTITAHAPGFTLLEVPFDVGAEKREEATLTVLPEPAPVKEEWDPRVYGGCASAPGVPLLGLLIAALLRRRAQR